MPAEATCPHCQLTLRVPENYGGKSVKCPQCQRRFTVGAPGGAMATAAPVAPAPPPAKSNSAAFDELVLSMLDEEEAEEGPAETPAAASPPAKPTTFKPPGSPAPRAAGQAPALAAKKGTAASHFWRCPKCEALWEKRPLPAAALENTRIKAKVRCETCGAAYDYQEVHSGKFDAAEVTVVCGKCHLEFSGPAEDLLGQPCPACGAALPKK